MINEYVRKWLEKALNDLKVTRNELNISGEDIVTDAVCFHAQQSAEKFIKAYLVSINIDFSKTHNLEYLLNLCIESDDEFKTIKVGRLTSYAIDVRYPDEFFTPSVIDAKESLKIAENIKVFIFKKMNITENELLNNNKKKKNGKKK